MESGKPSVERIQASLNELKQYTDKKSPAIIAVRKRIWREILSELRLDREQAERMMVEHLNCPAITVRRWVDGKFAPRVMAIEALLRLFTLSIEGKSLEPDIPAEPPVLFNGSNIAIKTVQEFFSCLQYAKFGLTTRGSIGYRRGRYPGGRDTLLSILKRPEHRFQMHYVYSSGTEADSALMGFWRFIKSNEPVAASKVFIWHTSPSDGVDEILRYSLPCLFLLIYNEDGVKKFNKSLDVWYEMPVSVVHPPGMPILPSEVDSAEGILVGLPEEEATALWFSWRRLLISTIVHLRDNGDFLERITVEDRLPDLFAGMTLNDEDQVAPFLQFREDFNSSFHLPAADDQRRGASS
jgi:hypothetical protein